MPQTSYALLTNLGRAKEAAALANATTITITHIAIGDGATVPSGGETALYHEVDRKTISGHGTVVGADNVAYFDCYLAAGDGPYTIREAGLYDDDGDLIAIAHYDPPINKPVPASGQTVEGTVRLEVAFSNIATVVIVVDPSMQVALQRLTRLPWIPVNELYRNAPPASPAVGDVYVIGPAPTGSWSGNAGKVAEYTLAGWAMLTPAPGHGISLPDGKIYEYIGGIYVELMLGKTVINQVLANNPTFPQIETASNAFSFSVAASQITIDPAQQWTHRGVNRYDTTDFDVTARRFATAASRTYHLRWHAPGTGDATPSENYPKGRFVLKNLADAGYNPSGFAETHIDFDSTYDNMLVARVVSDGANALTVTALKNKAVLSATSAKTTYEYNTGNSGAYQGTFRHLPRLDLTLNWARTPTVWSPVSMEAWWPASAVKSIVAFSASFKARYDSYLDPTDYFEPAFGPTRYIARAAVYGYDADASYAYKSGTITMNARA